MIIDANFKVLNERERKNSGGPERGGRDKSTHKRPEMPYVCEWKPALTSVDSLDEALTGLRGKVTEMRIKGEAGYYLVHDVSGDSLRLERLTREYNRYRLIEISIGGKQEQVEDVFLIKENRIEVVKKRDCGFLSISQSGCPSLDLVADRVPIASRGEVLKYTAHEKARALAHRGGLFWSYWGFAAAIIWTASTHPSVQNFVNTGAADLSDFRITGLWGGKSGEGAQADSPETGQIDEKQSVPEMLIDDLGKLTTPLWNKAKDGFADIPTMFSGKDSRAEKDEVETLKEPKPNEPKPQAQEREVEARTPKSAQESDASQKKEISDDSEARAESSKEDAREAEREKRQVEASQQRSDPKSQPAASEEEPKKLEQQKEIEEQETPRAAPQKALSQQEIETRRAIERNQRIRNERFETRERRLRF